MAGQVDIHENADDEPIVTRYEPNFQRVFARGSLLQFDEEEDDGIVQLAFWSSRDRDVEITEDGEPVDAVGYRLETEVMLEWERLVNLHELLGSFIDEHGPASIEDDDQ